MTIIMSTLFHTWTYIILPPRVDYFTQWNYGPLPHAQSSYDIRILQPVSQIVPDQVTRTALMESCRRRIWQSFQEAVTLFKKYTDNS